MAKNKIEVQGITIRIDKGNYISITDIAKQVNERTDLVLSNWLRNASTLDFLFEWEQLYNENFNPFKFEGIRKEAGKIGFVMTAKKWIETTNSIGITSKSGRYGGTYAHKDIAIEFCSAISARFKLHLIREFQVLKDKEAKSLNQIWDVNRYLSKINYQIHTDSVKEFLVSPKNLPTKSTGVIYASEADVLNMAVYRMTAKQWKLQNPTKKGNIRDNSTIIQLQVLANLEVLNAKFIEYRMPQHERLKELSGTAETHFDIINNSSTKLLK